MGNGSSSIKYVSFEEVQRAINSPITSVIINTLPITDQHCLIVGSIVGLDEETRINQLLAINKKVQIIVYGENCADTNVIKKATQLYSLGFSNICVYGGGLFEWLLLQDVYGGTEFRTTNKNIDLLKYK